MSTNSRFIHDNLSQYVNFEDVADPFPDCLDSACTRCDHTENLYIKNSGNDKGLLFCSACLFFIAQVPTADESQKMTIKQKDTLLIISPKQTIVLGDVSSKIFTNSKIKVIEPKALKKDHDKTWRNTLAEYLLFDHSEWNEPALVIFQSKAEKSSTFEISYSPNFVKLCGQFEERMNVKRLQAAYEIIKDIPTKKWQELLALRERETFDTLSETTLKKLAKLKESYPILCFSETDLVMPLRGSNEFYFLGWAQKRGVTL